MTPTEFCHWLRGIASDPKIDTASLGAQVLLKVAEIKGAKLVASVPALKVHPLANFCVHNINLKEPCAPCALGQPGTRLYGVRLPVTARLVYTTTTDQEKPADG